MHEIPRARALAPERKVTAAGAAGLAVTVLVYVAGLLGLDMPAEVAAAAVGLAAFGAGWLAKHTTRPDLGEEG